jgi:light-regulated signal transduction histidine kinase (bacteriophytochrome)
MTALERTNQELDQFAYVASHDLKAPLRGIANLSQWIEEDSGEAFPAESRHKMELLRGRVHRLEGLIDGILEYSRAGRSRVAATSVNVQALVQDVVDLLDPPETVSVHIAPDLPPVVAEAVPLSQVFSNLISNAIKYGARPDSVIFVTAKVTGSFVLFSVTDNGPGIPPQYHERIFVVFQTLAPRDKVEGTGIGLAVVKKIVEARHGRVWVESPLDAATGKGTTFHFTWPRVPGREP